MVVSERVKCGWHQFIHILQVHFAEVYEKFVMLVIVGFACYCRFCLSCQELYFKKYTLNLESFAPSGLAKDVSFSGISIFRSN